MTSTKVSSSWIYDEDDNEDDDDDDEDDDDDDDDDDYYYLLLFIFVEQYKNHIYIYITYIYIYIYIYYISSITFLVTLPSYMLKTLEQAKLFGLLCCIVQCNQHLTYYHYSNMCSFYFDKWPNRLQQTTGNKWTIPCGYFCFLHL